MESPERKLENTEKGISIEACTEKANLYIEQNGECLFVLDLKKSRENNNNSVRLDELLEDLNTMFDEHLPHNQLRTQHAEDRGFMRILGDGILAGISSSQVIPEAAEYIEGHYSDLDFYYNVAVDGYDEDGIRTIK